MKSRVLLFLLMGLLIIPVSPTFAFVGFGLSLGQEMATVDGYSNSLSEDNYEAVMTRGGFENPYSLGGYLYLDFIPFIDLEADFNLSAATYDFNFSNYASDVLLASTPDDAEFTYARGSAYLTARKKLLGVGLPILGGVKIHAGGGMNFHRTAPYMSIDMMQNLLGDDLYASFVAQTMQDKIIEYVEDNLESATGLHIQAGIQVKLLVLDTFVNYRYTIAKDIFPDQNGFGALNIRLGLGF